MDHTKLREAIDHVRDDVSSRSCARCQLVVAAATAHLETLPKTKMVEVWRVEFVGSNGHPHANTYWTEADAKESLTWLRGHSVSCIRVTGPHQQEVPE